MKKGQKEKLAKDKKVTIGKKPDETTSGDEGMEEPTLTQQLTAELDEADEVRPKNLGADLEKAEGMDEEAEEDEEVDDATQQATEAKEDKVKKRKITITESPTKEEEAEGTPRGRREWEEAGDEDEFEEYEAEKWNEAGEKEEGAGTSSGSASGNKVRNKVGNSTGSNWGPMPDTSGPAHKGAVDPYQ